MSYALTDSGEQDMKAEMKALAKLEEDIDQLASDARDCDTVAPKLKTLLDIAWCAAEKYLREEGISSCGHVTVQRTPYCGCCSHFEEMRNLGDSTMRRI